MAIFFHKTQRGNPQDPTGPKKWYLALKRVAVKRTREVARLMADETSANPKECEMSIYQLVKVLKFLLKEGDSVQLDDMGTFYLTANSSASDTEEEVTARNCKALNVRFRPTAEFQADINTAQLKSVTDITGKK